MLVIANEVSLAELFHIEQQLASKWPPIKFLEALWIHYYNVLLIAVDLHFVLYEHKLLWGLTHHPKHNTMA